MPQMAPMLWLPLFSLILLLLFMVKSSIYFLMDAPNAEEVSKSSFFTANWPW